MKTYQQDHLKLMVIDDLSPEDEAMLQALYSRSAESAEVHLEKVRKADSGNFMSQYYVGYGHKSIADCGTTTMFIENVSLLAAKAFQDWPLYSGQETSTRYVDMTKQHIVDPVNTAESGIILDDWMAFYKKNHERVGETVAKNHPPKEGDTNSTYSKAVKARVFDVLRGFLPAGITTQLSWHSNLRQAGDHLSWLAHHPAKEINSAARELRRLLGEMYPSSGLGLSLPLVSGVDGRSQKEQDDRQVWESVVATRYTYQLPRQMFELPTESSGDMSMVVSEQMSEFLEDYKVPLKTRPRGCVLPPFMADFGQIHFQFLLDFGSFRDIQRHRNGVCRMPLLETKYGFETWYLDQLDPELRKEAEDLIFKQVERIVAIDDPIVRQYYTALGFRVPTSVSYGLPATIYVLELRSGKTIHPTLRRRIHGMVNLFQKKFPDITLHVDMDPDDWTVRRGTQTITERT